MANEITKEHILKADGDELERLLGEALQPGDHVWNELHPPSCIRCGERRKFTEPNSLECQKPIPLDWDNAMKYFGEIEDGDTISLTPRDKAMIEWFSMESEATGIPLGKILPERTTLTAAQNYLLSNLDPVDFLRIAAICKLERK
jgi:hypothetical protein